MTEADVLIEVKAVQAVYGDDCHLLCAFPPHLTVQLKPRTAGDSSQQFVEVALGIRASTKYPEEPPHIYIADMKGMDDGRQAHLVTSITKKSHELSSYPMLVALCEEAGDLLTNMNHPEGDCSLCLYPLVSDDKFGTSLPFMKLMSCYHCFHSECVIRLWSWIHEKNETKELNQILESAPASVEIQKGDVSRGKVLHSRLNQQKGNCPVCRKVFNARDIEHVLEYLAANSSVVNPVETVPNEEEESSAILQSEVEKNRKQRFEAILKLQQENKGLIEPRKDLAISPGLFLPEPPATAAETKEEEFRVRARGRSSPELNGAAVSGRTAADRHKNSNRRRMGSLKGPKGNNGSAESSKMQWVVKPMNAAKQ